jgi:alkylation response protein AidB-like acyl-CoA dehydrogenase
VDFGLSEEQTLLQDTIRRYVESECPATRVRAIMESATGHDPDLWRGLAELGVAGLVVPAEHGGTGLELLDAALAAEVLGWGCTPGPFLG